MFEKEKDKVIPGPGTVVGANVKLTGVLKDINDITVHGKIDGEVISEKNVTVSETAEVKGPVSAQNVVVAGKVNGSITAIQKLELLPTARVSGSLTVKDLTIKSGAIFNGKSTMPADERGDAKAKIEEKSDAHHEQHQKENKSEPAYELE